MTPLLHPQPPNDETECQQGGWLRREFAFRSIWLLLFRRVHRYTDPGSSWNLNSVCSHWNVHLGTLQMVRWTAAGFLFYFSSVFSHLTFLIKNLSHLSKSNLELTAIPTFYNLKPQHSLLIPTVSEWEELPYGHSWLLFQIPQSLPPWELMADKPKSSSCWKLIGCLKSCRKGEFSRKRSWFSSMWTTELPEGQGELQFLWPISLGRR